MRRLVSAVRGLALAALACAPAAAGPGSTAARYEVVLASGERITASSRPLVAMGKVSFLDEQRRPVTLASAIVDVEATRARLGRSHAPGKVWDEKSLQKQGRSQVQFYGDEPPAAEAPVEAGAGATTGATQDDESRMSPAMRLRTQIDGLNAQIRGLPTSDRQRSMLVIRQLELQQELSRILDAPPRRG